MNRTEIRDFKKFLDERNVYLMFSQNYRQNHLTVNPPTMEAYLERAKAENVIPQAKWPSTTSPTRTRSSCSDAVPLATTIVSASCPMSSRRSSSWSASAVLNLRLLVVFSV